MATTISNGLITLTATAVEFFATTRDAGNVVHKIIGTNVPAVVYRDASLRYGTIRIATADRAAAEAMSALLGYARPLTLVDSDVPQAAMTFAATNTIEIQLDETGAAYWVESGFQAVSP